MADPAPLATHHQAVLDILDDLVGFPTISQDIAAQEACLGYIAERLKRTNLQTQILYSNGVPSLVASSSGGKHAKLILQAHLDVVPGPKSLFALQSDGEALIGRGAYDMKFAAACFIAAAEALTEQNEGLDYMIMLTCDEEVGGKDGVAHLLDQGYSADICLLPDGGTDWAIEEHAKGAWFITVCADGKSAHGSRPWEGQNANHRLLDFLQAVRQQYPSDDAHHTTAVISQIQSGRAINQVPDTAQAVIDVRFLDAEAKWATQQTLYDLAKQHQVKLTTHTLVEACQLDVTLPLVKTWKQIAEQQSGKAIGHCLSFGASDANYFNKAGIPTIVTRPLGGKPHGPDEWIDQADLCRFYEAVTAYVQAVAVAK